MEQLSVTVDFLVFSRNTGIIRIFNLKCVLKSPKDSEYLKNRKAFRMLSRRK